MNKQSLLLRSKKIVNIMLGVIVLISILTRFVQLDKYPPSITWDEASVGYNAYTIIHWGKDEWGKTLPITFKSFGDDKNPVHVYLTAPFVGLFGLNDYATRASAAFFGVLNVIAIFFLAREIFKSDKVGLLASFFLAISPYNIQFSRFNHELNFAIFFFLAGTFLFYKGLRSKGKNYIWISFLLFGIDLLTYQSAKVVTPPLVLLLATINIKKLLKSKKQFFCGLAIYAFFISLLFIKPQLLGGERLKQNQIPKNEIEETSIYKKTSNEMSGMSEIVFGRYKKYFQSEFLFISGDSNPRHSIQSVGTFYWLDLPLLIVGLLAILWRLLVKKNKQMLVLIAWILLAPLPGAVSSDMPHAARAMFLTGSWTLIIAYGAFVLITLFKNKYARVLSSVLIVLAMIIPFRNYLKSYYGEYAEKYAIEWVYGMKEIVEFTKNEEVLYRVYMTDAFMQPYIFYLYYHKVPLPEYLETVKYNQTESRPSNLVSSFGIYRFDWDQYQSQPADGVLYVVNPSVYDGLFHKPNFEVAKLVKYPNGSNAFYLLLPKY